jgi:cell division protein FtsI/penicillin-binding protein 2
MLAGKAQTVLMPRDPNLVGELPNIPNGASLVLTIDRDIQSSMEDLIDSAVENNGADSGTIVVLDPQTGEILAAATTPRLDLNEYWDYAKVFKGETPFNRIVSQAYEPGSVYKVLTMAAALDKGAVKPDTTFIDTGVIEVGGAYIYNWNSGAWGPQDMTGCLQHSLNVCLAWVATQLGAKDFYSYMRSFGIGHSSGVDLAGEQSGRLKVPGDEDWYDADLGTNAFGQGVAATPLQMAAAIAAVANDGKMMAPHIVRAIVDKGQQFNIEPRVISVPIRKETAKTLTDMLAISLEEEASDALVEGYRVAGKTGTAEIPTPFGYSSSATNASFVGWGPVDDPQFLVYIWLEKPTSSPWGSIVAAPVFRQAVEKLVVLMDIPPDRVRRALTQK